MFNKFMSAREQEEENFLKYFHLGFSKNNEYIAKIAVLEKKGVDLNLIKNVLDRLDVPYDDSDKIQFKVLMPTNKFVETLDIAFPKSLNTTNTVAKSAGESKNNLNEPSNIPSNLSDSMDSKAQQVLSNCQTKNHKAGLPLFIGEVQKQLLISYICEGLNTLDIQREDETKSQFDTRIRGYRTKQNTLRNQFKTQFGKIVSCDEVGDPEIFLDIQNELKQVEKQKKAQFIQKIFPYTLENLNALEHHQFQVIYKKATNFLQQFEVTKNVLETLCERGGLPKNIIDVQMSYNGSSSISNIGNLKGNAIAIHDSFVVDPLQHIEVIITASNEAIGYSIYNLLVIANVYPSEPFSGNPNKIYDAPMYFKLNYEDFSKMQIDLGDLSKWYRDFENILSALFASDSAQYVKTGCKSLREAVKTEIGREKSGLPPLINRAVKERFNNHPKDLFLLFGQCAIDLTNHPDREQMRDLIQRIYDLCNLRDSKNDRKTFVKDENENLTFISLLNVMQIREIYNEIMALSDLSKSAKEMGFNSIFAYVDLVGSGDIKEFYHAYLQQMLQDIFMANSIAKISENVVSKRRRIEGVASRLFPKPNIYENESFASIQKRFHIAIQNYLNETMDIRCKIAKVRADLAPTDLEKNALLVPQQTRAPIKFEIADNTQLKHTFKKFRESSHFNILSESYVSYYRSTMALPILEGATNFDKKNIYMYQTIDECLKKLCTEFESRQNSQELGYAKLAWLNVVMKMVYADKMKISVTDLDRLAKFFADVFKIDDARDDLGRGCNTGLAARCLALDGQLISTEDDTFTQFIRQLLRDNVEQSFNDTVASINRGESSMAARIRPTIMEYVGLDANPYGRNVIDMADLNQFMRDLATRYNPGKIYDECYIYLCNEFKRCAHENDMVGMSTLFDRLGYSLAKDAESLQIDGHWNIKLFETFLPKKLVEFLLAQNIFFLDNNSAGVLIIEATDQRYAFAQMINEKQQRNKPKNTTASNLSIFNSAVNNNQGVLVNNMNQVRNQPVNNNQNNGQSATAWSFGGLFNRNTQQSGYNTNANSVNLGGDSYRSTQPNTGSTG